MVKVGALADPLFIFSQFAEFIHKENPFFMCATCGGGGYDYSAFSVFFFCVCVGVCIVEVVVVRTLMRKQAMVFPNKFSSTCLEITSLVFSSNCATVRVRVRVCVLGAGALLSLAESPDFAR